MSNVLRWAACLLFTSLLLAGCGGGSSSSDTSSTGTATGSAPTITTQPVAQTVTSGASATFSIVASGSGTLSYQWQLDGSAISGATAASYSTGTAGTYRVVVSNAFGSVTSDAVALTLTAAGTAPVISTQPASQTITSGASATFSVVASGSGTLSYQWQRDGTALSGATSASYSTGTAGSYQVTVSNAYGSVLSSTAVLTVTAAGTSSAWNLASGAHEPDGADTSAWPVLTIALDTLALGSNSSRLVVGASTLGTTSVTVDGGAGSITVARDTFGVTITATLPDTTHVRYVLSGSASASLTFYSSTSFGLTLSDATVRSTDGPALNIQSKQTAFVALSGSSTLSDTSTWTARSLPDGTAIDLKATFFSEGALVFSGAGSLRVDASTKHAIASDAHLRLRSGTLTLAAAKKDGIRTNNAFVMDGGTLTITSAAGKGIKVDGKEDATQPLGFIAINAGTLNVTSYDKAVTAAWESAEDGTTATLADDPDPRVTINGGSITISTTGVPTTDLAPEGIEAKSTLTVNGGTLEINTTDDAINAGSAIVITGGSIYAHASNNDAIDSNGTLTISGGIVVADGASGAEGGLDCDNNRFAVTGGVFVGIGGRNSSVTASASTQNTVAVRNVTASTWVLRDASGNAAFAFTVPKTASAMLISSPLISTGTRYTVVTGGTLGSVGSSFHGLAINPTTHSGGTAGSSLTISSVVSSL